MHARQHEWTQERSLKSMAINDQRQRCAFAISKRLTLLREIADVISDISSFPRARESGIFFVLSAASWRKRTCMHACMKLLPSFGKHAMGLSIFKYDVSQSHDFRLSIRSYLIISDLYKNQYIFLHLHMCVCVSL